MYCHMKSEYEEIPLNMYQEILHSVTQLNIRKWYVVYVLMMAQNIKWICRVITGMSYVHHVLNIWISVLYVGLNLYSDRHRTCLFFRNHHEGYTRQLHGHYTVPYKRLCCVNLHFLEITTSPKGYTRQLHSRYTRQLHYYHPLIFSTLLYDIYHRNETCLFRINT